MKTKQENRNKGNQGEDIACKFLVEKGYRIITRNYRKKWGELDVVAVKSRARADNKTDVLDFFEVKSVTVKEFPKNEKSYRPEENVDSFKSRQIRRMIQTFLAEAGKGTEAEFRFHILAVYMNTTTQKARVKWLKDIIL